jgi:hypothetical protein
MYPYPIPSPNPDSNPYTHPIICRDSTFARTNTRTQSQRGGTFPCCALLLSGVVYYLCLGFALILRSAKPWPIFAPSCCLVLLYLAFLFIVISSLFLATTRSRALGWLRPLQAVLDHRRVGCVNFVLFVPPNLTNAGNVLL